MELEGRLNPSMSLPEVLQFLSMGKMTGILTITQGSFSASITLRHGKFINSSSLGRPRRLGQLLINRDIVTRAAIEEAAHYQRRENISRPLGQILIERGHITPEQLRQAIRLQLEEDMWDLFAVQEGSFKFEHRSDESLGEAVIELDVEPLIIDGTRRLDEWARIVKNIPGDHMVAKVTHLPDLAERDSMAFSDNEWRVLSLPNGFYDIGSIVNRSGIGRFETYRMLNSFMVAGLIEIAPPPMAPPNMDDPGADEPSLSGPGGEAECNEEMMDRRFAKAAEASSDDYEGDEADSSKLLNLISKNLPKAAEQTSAGPGELSFANPVQFVAAMATQLTSQLLSHAKMLGAGNESQRAEFIQKHWRHVLMSYPKADLIKATGSALDTSAFDNYARVTGLDGPLADCYRDSIEALGHYLRNVFLVAKARIGEGEALQLFGDDAAELRRRASVDHAEAFDFTEFAEKIIT